MNEICSQVADWQRVLHDSLRAAQQRIAHHHRHLQEDEVHAERLQQLIALLDTFAAALGHALSPAEPGPEADRQTYATVGRSVDPDF